MKPSKLTLPFEWKQGEHVSISGSTGTGKSTLSSSLLLSRSYVLILRSKPDDVDYSGRVIKTAKQFAGINYEDTPRVILDPAYESQLLEFYKALELAFKHGGWTVYFDELYYLSETLRLGREVDKFLTQGRSKGLTAVCGMQRPIRVSRFAISEATHTISFRAEGRDVKQTLSQICNEKYAEIVMSLDKMSHQFAWFYQKTDKIWVGRMQDLMTTPIGGKYV